MTGVSFHLPKYNFRNNREDDYELMKNATLTRNRTQILIVQKQALKPQDHLASLEKYINNEIICFFFNNLY